MQRSFLKAFVQRRKEQRQQDDVDRVVVRFDADKRPQKRAKSDGSLEVVLEDDSTRLVNSLRNQACQSGPKISTTMSSISIESTVPFSPLDFDVPIPSGFLEAVVAEEPQSNAYSPQQPIANSQKLTDFLKACPGDVSHPLIRELLATHKLSHLMGLGTQTQKETLQPFCSGAGTTTATTFFGAKQEGPDAVTVEDVFQTDESLRLPSEEESDLCLQQFPHQPRNTTVPFDAEAPYNDTKTSRKNSLDTLLESPGLFTLLEKPLYAATSDPTIDTAVSESACTASSAGSSSRSHSVVTDDPLTTSVQQQQLPETRVCRENDGEGCGSVSVVSAGQAITPRFPRRINTPLPPCSSTVSSTSSFSSPYDRIASNQLPTNNNFSFATNGKSCRNEDAIPRATALKRPRPPSPRLPKDDSGRQTFVVPPPSPPLRSSRRENPPLMPSHTTLGNPELPAPPGYPSGEKHEDAADTTSSSDASRWQYSKNGQVFFEQFRLLAQREVAAVEAQKLPANKLRVESKTVLPVSDMRRLDTGLTPSGAVAKKRSRSNDPSLDEDSQHQHGGGSITHRYLPSKSPRIMSHDMQHSCHLRDASDSALLSHCALPKHLDHPVNVSHSGIVTRAIMNHPSDRTVASTIHPSTSSSATALSSETSCVDLHVSVTAAATTPSRTTTTTTTTASSFDASLATAKPSSARTYLLPTPSPRQSRSPLQRRGHHTNNITDTSVSTVSLKHVSSRSEKRLLQQEQPPGCLHSGLSRYRAPTPPRPPTKPPLTPLLEPRTSYAERRLIMTSRSPHRSYGVDLHLESVKKHRHRVFDSKTMTDVYLPTTPHRHDDTHIKSYVVKDVRTARVKAAPSEEVYTGRRRNVSTLAVTPRVLGQPALPGC